MYRKRGGLNARAAHKLQAPSSQPQQQVQGCPGLCCAVLCCAVLLFAVLKPFNYSLPCPPSSLLAQLGSSLEELHHNQPSR